MEPLDQPLADVELNLLTEWGDPNSRTRTRKAAVMSVVVHAVVLLTLGTLPESVYKARRQPLDAPVIHQIVTPLIEPLTELTQKAPNKGKVTKEFNAAEVTPRPRIQSPTPAATTPRPAAPREAVIPAMPAPKPVPATPLPEPPKVDTAVKAPAKTDLPGLGTAAVPQIQPVEKPKLALENVGAPPPPVPAGHSAIPIPGNAVAEALRQAGIRGRAAYGGRRGDAGTGRGGGEPDAGAGIAGEPVATAERSAGGGFQAVPDPRLASVKQHWLAVIPESVRYGRRGSVAIQFSIARDGQVPKLVIARAHRARTHWIKRRSRGSARRCRFHRCRRITRGTGSCCSSISPTTCRSSRPRGYMK